MNRRKYLFSAIFLSMAFGLISLFSLRAQDSKPQLDGTKRPIYLASGLAPEHFISLSANVAAADKGSIVLLDVPKSRGYLKAFLKAYRPSGITVASPFPEGIDVLERQLETKATQVVKWENAGPEALWKSLFPKAAEVVVCGASPRRLLLQAACLAGAAKAPLYVLEGKDQDEQLRTWLAQRQAGKIYVVGDLAAKACRNMPKMELQPLNNEESVATLYLRLLLNRGAIQTLVLANPADVNRKLTGMSSLAPWVALERRGVLLLTNDKGTDAGALVHAALKNPDLGKVENVILVADLSAIPMERKPNPLPGKDEYIQMEPPAPADKEPFSFATGRLFDEEPGMVTLMLARRHLLNEAKGPRKALIVSNPGGGLPLLETISRNTALEFKNGGYQTTTLFHHDATKEEVRRLLPEQDVFLWEGHHSTLVTEFGVPQWTEPLRPSLVFLQSCLALTETEAHPFLRRGALAVIGSPSRTYSASGGAFTLAYFNALTYDRQSLGGSLRQAKNFLLAYSRLKEKRLGEAVKLDGASVRAAWAFTLWGDPTLHLPAPTPPQDALATIRPLVKNNRITLILPGTSYEEVKTEKYAAKLWPNGRLAGYVTSMPDESRKRLLPMLFAEVVLPKALLLKAGEKKIPQLRSKLAEDRWVFTWDQRRGAGYLLVLPGSKERKEIQFDIGWQDAP